VANDLTREGAGFNTETNIVHLLFRDGREERLPLMSKYELAHLILDRIKENK
jgi:phosphopantothenoylcysteine decarboxylase/phosphopantothenate--cysteine ligase